MIGIIELARRRAAIALLALALAGCGGGADVATEEPIVAEPPSAASVQVFVSGVAAAPLADVQVQAAGSTTLATTGADGSGSLVLASATPTLLKFSKPGYADTFKAVAFGAGSTATLVNVRLRAREAAQSLDAGVGGTLVARDGALVELPAGSLVDAETGVAVSGMVDIAMTPIDVSGDDLAAFPGRFRGLAADGSQPLIASYGTTEFSLAQGGRRLNLAPGRSARILLPIYTPMHAPGVPVAVGDVVPLWSLDESTGWWKQEGTGTVVASDDSPTGLALSATVTHFSWWNCDMPVDQGRFDVDIEMPDVDDDDKVDSPPPSNPDDIDTDPNRYRIGPTRLIRIDGRTADDRLLRQAGIDFEAAFKSDGDRADRKRAQGAVYAGPTGLIGAAGRRISLTACAAVQRGGTGFPLVLACGTTLVTVAKDSTEKVTIPLVVDAPLNLPVIVIQPRSSSVDSGQAVELSVSAVRAFGGSARLSYQWTRNGVPVAGADATTYTTPALAAADSGAIYGVIVSAPVGSTSSLPARVLVNAPPPPPLPPAEGDRFVNASIGSDANPGSTAAPYRSISFAIGATPAGGVTWLQDGTWTSDVDPALASGSAGLNCRPVGVVVADNVRLRAVRQGGATVRYDSQSGICLRQAELHGIRFHGPPEGSTHVYNGGIRVAGPGATQLSGVAMENSYVTVFRGARVDISPNGLASYGHPGAYRNATLAVQDEGTVVTVNGGSFDAVPQIANTSNFGCTHAAVSVIAKATLVLDGVGLRADPASAVSAATPAYGLQACSGATLELRGATRVEGFSVGARISGSTLHMDASSLVGNGTGMLMGPVGSSATLAGSAVQGSAGDGIAVTGSGSRLTLAAGSAVRNSGRDGIALGNRNVELRIDGAELSGNGALGLRALGTNCSVRNTSMIGNLGGGIVIENTANPATSDLCDLGSVASPGGNTFLNAGANLLLRTRGVAVQAVGNVWTASEQGADAQGRYSVPQGQTAATVTGPSMGGRNVRIELAGSSVTLAQ